MKLYNLRVLERDGLRGVAVFDLAVDGEDRDASGLILSPGWVDLHAHLRDPGFPEKETLTTGAASAAFGGFTYIVAMANTRPVTDDAERLRALAERAAALPIGVGFAAAVTKNLDGRELTDATALRQAGAVALSDDGRHAMDAPTLKKSLELAAASALPVFIHGQKEHLGESPAAESEAISEAIDVLAEVRPARLHIQHVSTAAGVELIRGAKRMGLRLTAEATPHHLALTEADALVMGPYGNVSPPLRSQADRQALLEGIADGTIDAIATDHAPHEAAAKAAGANGFHGFETAVGVVLGLGLDPAVLYRACVEAPSRIVDRTTHDASDWILIDPELEWTVDPSSFKSRGKNTPFAARRLRGRVVMTICAGQIVFERMVQRV
jgi:dihydroorotase